MLPLAVTELDFLFSHFFITDLIEETDSYEFHMAVDNLSQLAARFCHLDMQEK